MNMDSNKSGLLKSWRPLIFLSQILGLTFFTGKIPRVATTLYRAFILALHILIVFDQIPIILYWTALQANIVDKTLQTIKISIAWVNYFLGFLVTVLRNGNICEALDNLTGLDLKLSNKIHKMIFRRQILFFIINFFILFLYQITSIPVSPAEIRKGHSSTVYIFINSLVVVTVAQFFESVLLIREYYKSLYSRMVTLKGELVAEYGTMSDITSCKEINQLRILHFALHDTCRMINKSYQIQLLLVLIRCFIEGTAVIAGLMADDISEDVLLSYIFRLSHFTAKLILVVEICYCCHVTLGESNKIVGQIYILSNSAKNEEVKNELKLFSIQALQIPLKFSIFTFFNLDMELLTKIIISVSSYIIIIYTFETSHEE